MDDFVEMASQLRASLHEIIDSLGIPIEEFEAAGEAGFMEVYEGSVSAEDAIFANSIRDQIGYVPIEVIQSICFAATYLLADAKAREKGVAGAIFFLTKAAEHIGFVRGYAWGRA